MKDLFDPVVFRGGARARNRLALAAMTNTQSHDDGTLADAEERFLAMRARGGFGIVTTCAAHVTKDGQGWRGELGVFADAHVPGLRRLAEACHAEGALAFAQIFHGGTRADRAITGERPWSASEAPDDPSGGPRAATEGDIARVIDAFARAAARAREAGLDGVEIHGAHGYLLTQFLSRTMNRREDAWGGSLENRARLLREVTRAVRASAPAPFVVGVRMSPEDWGGARGLDLDESVEVARGLADDGVDYVHVSLWNAFVNTTKRPTEHAVTIFREALPPDVAVAVAGSIWTREEAEQMLARGADLVALGRAAILNPEWPERARDPSFAPQRPPLRPDALAARGVSPPFVDYLRRRFPDLVAG